MAATALAAFRILACGPDFPNRLLDGGDEAVLRAPFADFFGEIRRMQLVAPTCRALPLTNNQTYAHQTAAADLDDLGAALRKAGVSAKDRVAIVKRYEVERARLNATVGKDKSAVGTDEAGEENDRTGVVARSEARVPEGLPGEFADYFRGAIAWHRGETNAAIGAWQALLERPATERRFRSTWAAFMLGTAFPGNDTDKATNYFRQVRSLVKDGFGDSLGLAAASLGWEAKVYYDQGKFLPAADLYLEQAAAGDPSSLVSLRWLAAKVLKQGGATVEQFATHSKAQRVITAYLLAEHKWGFEPGNFETDNGVATRWLAAVEAAGLKDVQAAEQLALAAYRYGDLDQARRWLKLARNTPVSQWLQAKLLLRDGRADEAAAMLARASKYFPLAPGPEASGRNAGLEGSLYANKGYGVPRSAADQLWGELGVFRLARREYAEALDALLRAEFWDDASYVAEQVLTLDELKAYVDREWPEREGGPGELANDDEALTASERAYRNRIANMRVSLRHLLARRLTRNNRGGEARPYFPQELLPQYDQLAAALNAGYDEAQPGEERAKQLMAAARIAQREGIQLLGTALEPDFANYGGGFEMNIIRESRKPGPVASEPEVAKAGNVSDGQGARTYFLHASDDELRRSAGEPADPPIRYHYRYVAAELGWAAAQLLPNNSDETARILCEAGSWIKYLNPQAADRFYKSLVRRCRKTEIGQWADYIRWFPLLDEKGNLRPNQPGPPKRKAEHPTDEQPSVETNIISPDDQGSEAAPSDDAGPPTPL